MVSRVSQQGSRGRKEVNVGGGRRQQHVAAPNLPTLFTPLLLVCACSLSTCDAAFAESLYGMRRKPLSSTTSPAHGVASSSSKGSGSASTSGSGSGSSGRDSGSSSNADGMVGPGPGSVGGVAGGMGSGIDRISRRQRYLGLLIQVRQKGLYRGGGGGGGLRGGEGCTGKGWIGRVEQGRGCMGGSKRLQGLWGGGGVRGSQANEPAMCALLPFTCIGCSHPFLSFITCSDSPHPSVSFMTWIYCTQPRDLPPLLHGHATGPSLQVGIPYLEAKLERLYKLHLGRGVLGLALRSGEAGQVREDRGGGGRRGSCVGEGIAGRNAGRCLGAAVQEERQGQGIKVWQDSRG